MAPPKSDSIRRLELAQDFSKRLYNDFGNFVKAIVYFGSGSRDEQEKDSDIDVMTIIDDITGPMDSTTVNAYRVVVDRHIHDVSDKLHVTSLKLSTFWELAKVGDPIVLNILRDGVAIIDSGFFDPLKTLLERGKMRPSPEAISNYAIRAKKTYLNARMHINQSVVDCYWAVIDSAHAALMDYGKIPDSPEHIHKMLEKLFYKDSDKKVLSKTDIDFVRELVSEHKKIERSRGHQVSVKDADRYLKHTEQLCDKLLSTLKKPKDV